MVNTVKFSQFNNINLATNTNMLVGVSAPSGGNNFQVSFPLSWGTSSRPSSPDNGTLGYNTSLGQYEYWNGAAWTQLAAGGSGSVNVGGINELAYYAANGTAVSGLTTADSGVLVTNASGVPSISSTLPALTLPSITFSPTTGGIVGTTTNDSAASGYVGQSISSIILSGSAVALSNNVVANITSILLTAGDWLAFGNISYTASALLNAFAWISETSATLPDIALYSELNPGSASGNMGLVAPIVNLKLAAPATVYLSGQCAFNSGSSAACGGITAIRIR